MRSHERGDVHDHGGGLVALDEPVDNPAAHYTDDLSPLPGQGEGLLRAAANSPALTISGGGLDWERGVIS